MHDNHLLRVQAIVLSINDDVVASRALELTFYRSAYDLDFLISRQPHNAMRSYHPTRSNTPQPNELEYLDVFDLFNFPRLPANGADALDDGNTSHMNLPHPDITPNLVNMNTAQIPDFSVPNPQEDWLFQ